MGTEKDPTAIIAPADAHRQVQATEAEINALVYELYGLTEEEIAIVEGPDH